MAVIRAFSDADHTVLVGMIRRYGLLALCVELRRVLKAQFGDLREMGDDRAKVYRAIQRLVFAVSAYQLGPLWRNKLPKRRQKADIVDREIEFSSRHSGVL